MHKIQEGDDAQNTDDKVKEAAKGLKTAIKEAEKSGLTKTFTCKHLRGDQESGKITYEDLSADPTKKEGPEKIVKIVLHDPLIQMAQHKLSTSGRTMTRGETCGGNFDKENSKKPEPCTPPCATRGIRKAVLVSVDTIFGTL